MLNHTRESSRLSRWAHICVCQETILRRSVSFHRKFTRTRLTTIQTWTNQAMLISLLSSSFAWAPPAAMHPNMPYTLSNPRRDGQGDVQHLSRRHAQRLDDARALPCPRQAHQCASPPHAATLAAASPPPRRRLAATSPPPRRHLAAHRHLALRMLSALYLRSGTPAFAEPGAGRLAG